MKQYRKDFPQLATRMNQKPLIYFDFAATSLKPNSVIDAVAEYYRVEVGNPGRSTHSLAHNASTAIEEVRAQLLDFLHGKKSYQAVFTKSATESINLVANSLAKAYRKNGKQKPTIITTEAEHHANLLPWMRLKSEYGFRLVIIPVTEKGTLNIGELLSILRQNKGASLAITHCSNATGNSTYLEQILKVTKENDITVLLDATQSLAHLAINLENTPIDFLVASAHKMYGPEGVGILIARNQAFKTLEPLLLGGGMIESVSLEDFSVKDSEEQFEAGTPNTAGIIGFGKALTYLTSIGLNNIQKQEEELSKYFMKKATAFEKLLFLGDLSEKKRSPIFSFTLPPVHPHDIADFLDQHGIAVRAGYHCAEPIHTALHVKGSVRVSLSFLNTTEEIDNFFAILSQCLQKFA